MLERSCDYHIGEARNLLARLNLAMIQSDYVVNVTVSTTSLKRYRFQAFQV